MNDALEFDKTHIWHPYTSMINPLPTYMVVSGNGVKLELADGRELIDGMSSWWCVIHGYNNIRLNNAIKNQLDKFAHVMFGGLTHQPAIDLTKRLTKIVPNGLDRVFFSDSGSVAVEVSIKMALQYHTAQGNIKKNEIATISGGYHGDTWHAMSVCDPLGGMHSLYNGRLPIQCFVPRPTVAFGEEWNEDDFAQMKNLIEQNHERLAGVIVEPIVQGAGGMWFYHPEYLRRLSQLCREYDVLLIADEIATGFGRTGKMFACEWSDITPDIMCVGKALTGGYMSFAATMTTSKVADTISSGTPSEFMHGPTFMGNPLACAVACESIDLFEDSNYLERIAEIESILRDELFVAQHSDNVATVRVLGAIGVIECNRRVDMAKCQKEFVDRGVWVRPFGRLVYIMPPYIISNDDLKTLCRAVIEVVKSQENEIFVED